MIGDANSVLRESGVVVAVGMRGICAEALQIIFRDSVGVGTERSQREPGFHGLEGEGIDLDNVEEILAALLAGVKIINPGDERVAAELERMAAGIEAQCLGKLGAVFARGAGE